MRLIAQPLTASAFAPFGTVVDAALNARVGPIVNGRPEVPPLLNWSLAEAQTLPLRTQVMERHRHSSQNFVPGDAGARWLLFVAPHAADGGPDLKRALAFIASGTQAVTYAMDTWHHPVCALDAPVRFAVLTYRDGGPDDEQFVDLPEPVEIVAGA